MHHFLNPFFSAGSWLESKKKNDPKNSASQQTCDPSYFVRALTFLSLQKLKSKLFDNGIVQKSQ